MSAYKIYGSARSDIKPKVKIKMIPFFKDNVKSFIFGHVAFQNKTDYSMRSNASKNTLQFKSLRLERYVNVSEVHQGCIHLIKIK